MPRYRQYGAGDDPPKTTDTGDIAWTGVYLNAEASQLSAGLLSDGSNLRCRTGRPTTRKGLWKSAWLNQRDGERILPWNKIHGQPAPFKDPNSVEWLLHAANEGVYAIRPYNTPMQLGLPQGIKIQTEVSFVQAFNLMFMLRGELMAPLVLEKIDDGFKDLIDRWNSTISYESGAIVADGPWRTGTVSADGTTLNITNDTPHGLISGSDVQIRGSAGGLQDGRYTVRVLDEFTFSFVAPNVSSLAPTLEWSTNRNYWTTQAAVPLTFTKEDISNLPSLADKLTEPWPREIDKWLYGSLASDTQAALATYQPPSK